MDREGAKLACVGLLVPSLIITAVLVGMAGDLMGSEVSSGPSGLWKLHSRGVDCRDNRGLD